MGTSPDDEAELLRICAWCGNVMVSPGTWVNPQSEMPSRLRTRDPTHGICPPCREQVEEAAFAE